MTALNKQALRQLAEKATHGEWWSDVVETDGEYGEGEDRASGYHSYAVYVGSESLLDMTNSTAACIHTEWDHDYLMAWDETAKRNAEFIAAANPATVLALLDELEAAEKRIAELERKEQHSDRQSVIDALASSGEEWSDIEEYMQKWDAERAAAAGKGE
ncbi:ead/Ea22-like family protein [Citrobacter freundii]|uniref:ead/Ea22-like family protein n=1 Tax=Citrobacter freundii TaxID=546 RepID=UPI00254E0CA5|nr:ead/Ea22-like family protein [Citrobacter freundii]MEC5782742.1 ead/Ea22-like family protein [Citrobacter freundii]